MPTLNKYAHSNNATTKLYGIQYIHLKFYCLLVGEKIDPSYTHLLLIALVGQVTSSKTEPALQIWHSHSDTVHLPSKMASLLPK